MTQDLVRVRRALISVSDKSGLSDLAAALTRQGVELVSTGGTARALRDAGFEVKDVSDLTGFPEMLDGRVKTLHPMVHGGLLYRRDLGEHVKTVEEHAIAPIDLVCVNLYPFEQTIARPGVTDEDAIENIDIGGPSMLRSAAKNHASVTVCCDTADYAELVEQLKANDGQTTFAFRRSLARKVFQRTSAYDQAIASYMAASAADQSANDSLPPALAVNAPKLTDLRYGENPHQAAAVYADPSYRGPSVVTADQLHGKPLSYNNLLDASAALDLALALRRASTGPSACVVKHTNPCGAAKSSTLAGAVRGAIAGDPMAAFGGILAVDSPLDRDSAELVAAPDRFFEVVIAPSFDDDALEMLRARWANVRLLAVGDPDTESPALLEHKSVPGGVLVQQRDLEAPAPSSWTHAAGPKPDGATLAAAASLETVVRALTSNAVCLGGIDDRGTTRLFGAGAGQMDRVASCTIAIEKAGELAKGAIALSDAFFPFPDGPELLIDAGVKTIVHPGGSKRDGETFDLCNERGVTCLTTGVRRFRH
ncbi:MAG: bifunctional phosphoribosylaminoimidazolecarboxamide formyltransferase/IMP cyclohydrolase [Planctomycetota bacterium]